MEIRYQLAEDDYRQGLLAWRMKSTWKRRTYRISFALMILVLVANALLLIWNRNPNMQQLSWMLIGFAVLWLLFVWMTPRLQARMQFSRMPSAQAPMTVTNSDSGMQVQSQHYDSRIAWSTYIGWAESKSVFVLFPQPRTYVPIPQRAFNDEQRMEFREILRRNIVTK
jgi:hypothetical protein